MDERQHTQFNARKLAYQDAAAQKTAALARSKADLEAARQVKEKLQSVLPMLKQAADSFQKLQKEGYVGELAANDKQREYMERERDPRSQESAVMSLMAAVTQSEAKLISIRSNYRSQLETERVELMATLNKSSSELDKSRIKSGLLDIKSPNDGIVKDLTVKKRLLLDS